MVAIDDFATQLIDIYYQYEDWHRSKLPREEAYKYFDKLLKTGNIQVYEQEGRILGYVEVWRINYAQFGRIICHERFSAMDEDISSGNICYLANTWIHPDFRHTNVYKILKLMFFKSNFGCDYFVGSALRKKTQPIKVFKKADLVSKLFKEGE